jgi:hypothetical protein
VISGSNRAGAERTDNRATAAAMRRIADELDELARLKALAQDKESP